MFPAALAQGPAQHVGGPPPGGRQRFCSWVEFRRLLTHSEYMWQSAHRWWRFTVNAERVRNYTGRVSITNLALLLFIGLLLLPKIMSKFGRNPFRLVSYVGLIYALVVSVGAIGAVVLSRGSKTGDWLSGALAIILLVALVIAFRREIKTLMWRR